MFFVSKQHWRHFGKGTQCGTVLPEMLTKLFVRSYFQQNKLLIYFFSFLWHKIIVLISNMFIYAKIGNSKFVEMHGVASDIYPSALVFYTRHRVNIIQLLHFIECDMICYGALKSNIDQGQDFSLLLLRPLSTL